MARDPIRIVRLFDSELHAAVFMATLPSEAKAQLDVFVEYPAAVLVAYNVEQL